MERRQTAVRRDEEIALGLRRTDGQPQGSFGKTARRAEERSLGLVDDAGKRFEVAPRSKLRPPDPPHRSSPVTTQQEVAPTVEGKPRWYSRVLYVLVGWPICFGVGWVLWGIWRSVASDEPNGSSWEPDEYSPNILEGILGFWILIGLLAVAAIGVMLLVAAVDPGSSSSSKQEEQVSRSAPTIGRDGYSAYMASSAWKEKRRAAIGRAEGRCQVCNRKGHLEVHHRRYDRLGNEEPGDLLVLCRTCHELFHKNRKVL